MAPDIGSRYACGAGAPPLSCVRHGVVNLSGPVESSLRQQDLIALVLRLVWDVDGVVDVVNRLGGATESNTA